MGKAEGYRGFKIPNFFNEPVHAYDTKGELELATKTQATRKGPVNSKTVVSIGAAVHLCGSVCSVAKWEPKTFVPDDPNTPEDEKYIDNFLKPWEYRALMTLLWEKELKLSDLNLNIGELAQVDTLKRELSKPKPDQKVTEPIQDMLRSKFLRKADSSGRTETPNIGDSERGKTLYSLSCARCHPGNGSLAGGPGPRLQPNVHNADRLQDRVDNISHKFGDPTAYMPAFPKERLSAQQIEDIKAFILSR